MELIDAEGSVFSVRGLDAMDGMPILEIKLCMPEHDSVL